MAGQRLLNVDAFIGKDGRHRTHLALNKASIGFPEWTMDFFIAEPLEEQNIIKIALLNMLLFLKSSIGVDNTYALIDQGNKRCLSLIEKLPFDERDNPSPF